MSVYFILLWLVWQKYRVLTLTCMLMAATVWYLSRSRRVPPVVPPDDARRTASRRWVQVLLGAAGLYCAWKASQCGFANQLAPMALWMGLSAVAWRVVALDPLPAPRGRTLGFLVLGLFVLGAVFRLYKAGAVPVGAACSDEVGSIWSLVWEAYKGARHTYSPVSDGGADGGIPTLMMMAGLKVFGTSMLGYRMEGILCGIAMTGLFYLLAGQSLGVWAGLGAAFFWAVSVWSVTVTRTNYYMAETLLWTLACVAMLALALRKGGAWRFAVAGLFWAFCFNVYPAARVLLVLVPWLFCLLWMFRRESRPALGAATPPLFLGFTVGLAPILIWLVSDYPTSVWAYFSAFYTNHEAGALTSNSLLGKMDQAFGRIFGVFHDRFLLFTQGGPNTDGSYLFPSQFPILHPWLFVLAVLGACVALARFRNAFCSFLLYWWFVGLLPLLASACCGGTASDRRAIISLPPTLLLAALGTETLARVARAALGKAKAATVLLSLACMVGASAYAVASWKDYFDRNQRDPALMTNGMAQYVALYRTLHAELASGGVLISTLRFDDGNFFDGMSDQRIEQACSAMLQDTPVYHYQKDSYTYDSEGFLEALKWALAQAPAHGPDKVYIMLLPFYDYLAPGLEAIGAQPVAEIPHVVSSRGPLVAGRDADPTHFARVFLIKNLDQAEVARYARHPDFEEQVTALIPPHGWTRGQVHDLNAYNPDYEPLVRAYERGDWSRGKTERWKTDDPWFWTASESLPGGTTIPYSFRMKAEMTIPKSGDYAFGASTTIWTRIKVDGRTVFLRDPYDAAAIKERTQVRGPGDMYGITWLPDVEDRRGFLGPPVHLEQGTHTVEIEQAYLSRSPNFTQVLRPVWRAPGRAMETLPLELLRPLP